MRITLLSPKGKLGPELVHDTLCLVMEVPPRLDRMQRWSPLELAIAYDWAMREHLSAADSTQVRRRPQPLIVELSL